MATPVALPGDRQFLKWQGGVVNRAVIVLLAPITYTHLAIKVFGKTVKITIASPLCIPVLPIVVREIPVQLRYPQYRGFVQR